MCVPCIFQPGIHSVSLQSESRLNTSQDVCRHIEIALKQASKLCCETVYIAQDKVGKVSSNHGQSKLTLS